MADVAFYSEKTIHEFINEDFQAQIGQPIYGCINITSISRL